MKSPILTSDINSARFTLPKGERLSKRGDIGHLFTDGEGFLVYPVKCTYLFRKSCDAGVVEVVVVDGTERSGVVVSSDCNRAMVTAPKRNHKRAVVRNLLKRRMREAYRLNKGLLVGGSVDGLVGEWSVDIALAYVGKGEPLDYQHIERAVIDILNRLCKIREDRRVF